MEYGKLPKNIGEHLIEGHEMLHYQYLPIKLISQTTPTLEVRLQPFGKLIGAVCCDFIGEYGLDRFVDSYVYLTAKRKYLKKGTFFNRGGYHSDGFRTKDINYVWCDKNPTIFNTSKFNLSLNKEFLSMKEMTDQALKENEVTFPNNTLLRLDEYSIHKVNENVEPGVRTFIKVSISKDKYDLKGNSKNYLLDYDWELRDRTIERNIPQKIKLNE